MALVHRDFRPGRLFIFGPGTSGGLLLLDPRLQTPSTLFRAGPAERMAALPAAIMALEPVPDVIVLTEVFKADHRRWWWRA